MCTVGVTDLAVEFVDDTDAFVDALAFGRTFVPLEASSTQLEFAVDCTPTDDCGDLATKDGREVSSSGCERMESENSDSSSTSGIGEIPNS